MVGLSWPLWVDSGDFPRVPFVAHWPEPGPAGAWVRLVALAGALIAVALGRGGRWGWALSAGCLVWSLLGDQDRLQPWVQQYLIVAVGMTVLARKRARNLARWSTIVLYAASGLSKLDAAFVDEVGRTFLDASGRLVGWSPDLWPRWIQVAAILAMPIGEILIAVALVAPATRLAGLAGSVIQHCLTIAILGPWALGHSAIVLVWNGAMIAENLALFGRIGARRPWAPGGAATLTAGVVVAGLAVGERWGWVDSWPAYALYASHAERAVVAWPDPANWPEAAVAPLPPAIRPWLGPADEDRLSRLDLTGWSRAVRGVPLYPQNRVACGIVEALVARYASPQGPQPSAVFLGRAGIGRASARARVECADLKAIRRRGDRFWINAHPATP